MVPLAKKVTGTRKVSRPCLVTASMEGAADVIELAAEILKSNAVEDFMLFWRSSGEGAIKFWTNI